MSASISSDSPYHGAATPTYKCAFGKFGPHPLENFMLAVKGQMVVKLRDKQMRQEVRPFHAAWDRTTGGRFLHHPLAASTGFLDPGEGEHLHLGCDHVEQFAYILAHHVQIATTVWTARTWVKLTAFRGVASDARGGGSPQAGRRQSGHDPREHTHVTPPFSAVIKRLRKSILLGASHHLNPLRFMKIIPLSTHLSS